LKLKITLRFFRTLAIRQFFANLTLTCCASIAHSLLAYTNAPSSQRDRDGSLDVDLIALATSIGFLVPSLLITLLCPGINWACGCVDAKGFASLTAFGFFFALLDLAAPHNFLISTYMQLNQAVTDCQHGSYYVDIDETAIDLHFWIAALLAGSKYLVSLVSLFQLIRLAFMPLHRPDVSPEQLARFYYEHYNARGLLGLIPTHHVMQLVRQCSSSTFGGDSNPGSFPDGAHSLQEPLASRISLVDPSDEHDTLIPPTRPTCGELMLFPSYNVSVLSKLKPTSFWSHRRRFCCLRCSFGGFLAAIFAIYFLFLAEFAWLIAVYLQMRKLLRSGCRWEP
jgi:hypothetical protein